MCGANIRSKLISIHALREEGDSPLRKWPQTARNFYPRPPRGGRRDDAATVAEVDNFYPRPPRGGRHLYKYTRCFDVRISIHALREEGDG